ncbi:prepilin peptidase [Paenibacillus agricola]|uniref:Prepilin peptidase n=1 Tax=Paenibacillus agricola TaxID=2716264 RepID=A0ABX0J3L9_9BACL|nr:A24 family peptidase [Paenibacillus agricola]NHN30737.1 prepilin peptidase [Paenibacillus agricola]
MNSLHNITQLYVDFFIRYPFVWVACIGLFGLLIGSFLNVVALRVPKKESFVYPPSHCVHCQHKLSAGDLIPVLSYIYLRGGCRYCGKPISPIYPIGELSTAVWFAILAAYFGPVAELFVGLFFVMVLVAVTLTDLKYMLIPDRIVFFAMGVGLLLRLFIHPLPLWQYALGFVVGGGVLYGIAWISENMLHKEGMGGGDIKLFAFIGLIVGPGMALFILFIACFLGTIIIGSLLVSGRWSRERHLPFAPFIALGALFVYVWGMDLIELYVQFIRS